MPAGGSLHPASHETVDQRLHYVKQDGQTVFKFAVRKTEEIARRLLERNGLTANDIDLFVSHQANRRIIQAATEKLGVDPSKVIINIERFGNTTAATIPLALNDALCVGPAQEGASSCCWPRSARASPSARSCCAGASRTGDHVHSRPPGLSSAGDDVRAGRAAACVGPAASDRSTGAYLER